MRIQVIKRNGSKSDLDVNKIHFVLEEATKGISGVSVSDIEMNASLRFFDGIKTTDIQEILIRSANSLISENTPNYEIVAARLINYHLRKEVFGDYITPPLLQVIKQNVQRKIYDAEVLSLYTEDEIVKLDSHIDHRRDEDFKSAGIQQCVDKYLLKDRITGQIYETPQYAYMLIAMTLFKRYDRFGNKVRLRYVKDYYDAISKFEINLPTPILCGARTTTRQYSSCVKIDIGDTMNSITHSDSAIKLYTSQRAGIGINVGRIRGIGSTVRQGEVIHTGLIPFLKCFESSVKCCTQNGVRGGSATVHIPYWHSEIRDIIVLKNNKGTDETRVRKLDYSIQLNKLFYERVQQNSNISLFQPNQVPELYDNMGNNDLFETAYLNAEKNPLLVVATVNARELFTDIIKERIETGRIYLMNMDNCNEHSSFTVPIFMSNLCQEITLPTKPLNSFNDAEGEIALCTLSAINLGQISVDRLHDQMKRLTDLAVRALDELISIQNYPLPAAENSTKRRRSLGIGVIGLAHFLAKNKRKYGSKECIELVDRVMESLQYHSIQASVELARTEGPCDAYHETKYSNGILPIDTYSKNVDKICSRELELDWEQLRSLLKEHGIRNSTLTAQMPSESSSVTSNETNGIEPPRELVQYKKSKMGILKMLVPEYKKYKDYYTFAWDETFDNKDYMNIAAVTQKYFDQAISINEYYNPFTYANVEIPVRDVMRNLMYGYSMGQKTAYYLNVFDGKEDQIDDQPSNTTEESVVQSVVPQDDNDCSSGACSI